MRDDTNVQDVMHREFLGVSESDRLDDAAALLLEESVDCLVVLRGGEPVGCLSTRDVLAAVLEADDPESLSVSDVMNPPAPGIEAGERLSTAEDRLIAEGSSRLIVTADGEAVGVLTERDILASRPTRAVSQLEPEPDIDPQERDRPVTTDVTQSICEVCGALTSSLSTANGQLVCPDCLEV